MGVIAFLVLAVLPLSGFASEAFIASLEKRVRTDGVEAVNAYLAARPRDLGALHQGAADCMPQAVDLTARLGRGTQASANKLHVEALRIAAGGCADYVLSRLAAGEVPRVCAPVSTWTVTQTARELRRRIQEIEGDPRLSASENGKACSAAYLFALQNTRVGVRAYPPGGLPVRALPPAASSPSGTAASPNPR